MPNYFVFGYGSLMNLASLQRTLPGKTISGFASLRGYRRIFNAPVKQHLYLNIAPQKDFSVDGVLIKVTREELKNLIKREIGYTCTEVTNLIVPLQKESVFTFIAPDKIYSGFTVLQSYLNTCLTAIPEYKRDQWTNETIIENEIEDDTKSPKYKNIPK